jgi:hypothetical protein
MERTKTLLSCLTDKCFPPASSLPPPACFVYNIEVHGEHVYQVGELGLVVHNVSRSGWGAFGWGQKSLEAGQNSTRTLGKRMTNADDALQQLREIERAQKRVRQGKSKQIIDNIEKSEQRAKNRLKDLARDPDWLKDME